MRVEGGRRRLGFRGRAGGREHGGASEAHPRDEDGGGGPLAAVRLDGVGEAVLREVRLRCVRAGGPASNLSDEHSTKLGLWDAGRDRVERARFDYLDFDEFDGGIIVNSIGNAS